MMTPHEQIMISAERYALGRRTYIVGDTVNYIIDHIDGMSEHCKTILIADIENPLFDNYGDDCDKAEWMKLLEELRNTTVYCSSTYLPCASCKIFCTNRYCRRDD